MRFIRTLKTLPRFLILAPVFGVGAALIALALSPSSATAQFEQFGDQTCTFTSCAQIGSFVGGGCPDAGVCVLRGTAQFHTCQPTGDGCVNSSSVFGSNFCVGRCGEMGPMCGTTAIHCANP